MYTGSERDRLEPEKREAILKRLKDTFQSVPPDVSLVDELIAERRAEAKKELEEEIAVQLAR